MAGVPREELLFTQLIIRSGLVTMEQYQEILEIRSKIAEKTGQNKAIDEILVERGFLNEKLVDNLWQKIGRPTVVSQKQGECLSLPDEDTLDNPTAPDNYQIEEKLGEGAAGVVYRAYRKSDKYPVAIKFLDPRYNYDRELVHRFTREAKAVTRLQHSNIVKALEWGEHKGAYFFAMEYVPGNSLDKILHKEGRMDEKRAVYILSQVADALQYAHDQGFIHRDIKPANILITDNNIAKLCDFGLIRGTEKETLVTQVGAFIGTPQYVAPEQARGLEDLDGRTDIYSLGCTLYHMLTGQPPYKHNNPVVVLTWQATKEFPDPRDIVPNLTSKLAGLIKKMTAKDRDLRLLNVGQLKQRLETVFTKGIDKADLVEKLCQTQSRSVPEISADLSKSRIRRHTTGRKRKGRESGRNQARNDFSRTSVRGDTGRSTSRTERARGETSRVKNRSDKLRESSSSYTSYRKMRETQEQKKNWGIIIWLLLSGITAGVLIWQIIKMKIDSS